MSPIELISSAVSLTNRRVVIILQGVWVHDMLAHVAGDNRKSLVWRPALDDPDAPQYIHCMVVYATAIDELLGVGTVRAVVPGVPEHYGVRCGHDGVRLRYSRDDVFCVYLLQCWDGDIFRRGKDFLCLCVSLLFSFEETCVLTCLFSTCFAVAYHLFTV